MAKKQIENKQQEAATLKVEYPWPTLGWPAVDGEMTFDRCVNHGFNTWEFEMLSQKYAIKLLIECIPLAPLTQVYHPETKDMAYRNHFRSQFTSKELANKLWLEMKGLFIQHPSLGSLKRSGRTINAAGLNTNFRLYRYAAGDAFGAHYDEEAMDEGRIGGYTLLIYLSGGTIALRDLPKSKANRELLGLETTLIGGETSLYTSKSKRDAIRIAPEVGKVVLHSQGLSCLLHEGSKVKTGVKWVLRSDVMFE
jgi:hypothetical protein